MRIVAPALRMCTAEACCATPFTTSVDSRCWGTKTYYATQQYARCHQQCFPAGQLGALAGYIRRPSAAATVSVREGVQEKSQCSTIADSSVSQGEI
jgi:hypothetical protein